MKLLEFATVLLFALISENSSALINGVKLSNDPDLVKIVFKNNSQICTGAFVDEYTLLTAAHCLTKNEAGQPLAVEKIISENDNAIEVQILEGISHPLYTGGFWHSHDVGLFKTSRNTKFHGDFKLDNSTSPSFGKVTLLGCGKIDLVKNERGRSTGENYFFRLGSILTFLGVSRHWEMLKGYGASVAPNDSGGLVLDGNSNRVIGVAATSTVTFSQKYFLPAFFTATSIIASENFRFIQEHLGPPNKK